LEQICNSNNNFKVANKIMDSHIKIMEEMEEKMIYRLMIYNINIKKQINNNNRCSLCFSKKVVNNRRVYYSKIKMSNSYNNSSYNSRCSNSNNISNLYNNSNLTLNKDNYFHKKYKALNSFNLILNQIKINIFSSSNLNNYNNSS